MYTKKNKESGSNTIPIYLFAGFLGSGKTTFLVNVLKYFQTQNKKMAVIINEIGMVNIDGEYIDDDIPKKEILGGCICCSVGNDLGDTIIDLQQNYHIDSIFIELTGVANPQEVISLLSEVALRVKIDLQLITTVIDAAYVIDLFRRSESNYTISLIIEQIKSGGLILLNKSDKVSFEDIHFLKGIIRKHNPHALVKETSHCQIDYTILESNLKPKAINNGYHHENLHTHVHVYTHYFDYFLTVEQFKSLFNNLSKEIYRAKGIIQFKDKKGPMLFQYAHGELEMMRISSGKKENNVAVFIGENFSKKQLVEEINRL
ncbi:GTP-binding protein [Cytobacillus sp. FSL M8-0252]|uniref:CobW family GTP-binding protein n=1 Tax=Cytobacillus sp. FSL M8-0252 TaxID=2921621 RepID=UPI0030F71300